MKYTVVAERVHLPKDMEKHAHIHAHKKDKELTL